MIEVRRSTLLADAKQSSGQLGTIRVLKDVRAHPARYAGAIAIALLTVPVAKLVLTGLVGRFLLFGFAGWAIEAVHAGAPRYSAVLGGTRTKIPLLPVYGVGGLLVTTMAPALVAAMPVGRALVYGGVLSGLEWGACRADRATGHESWDYDGECVDAAHFVEWGVLGRIVEHAAL